MPSSLYQYSIPYIHLTQQPLISALPLRASIRIWYVGRDSDVSNCQPGILIEFQGFKNYEIAAGHSI